MCTREVTWSMQHNCSFYESDSSKDSSTKVLPEGKRDLRTLRCMSERCTTPPALLCQENATIKREILFFQEKCWPFWCAETHVTRMVGATALQTSTGLIIFWSMVERVRVYKEEDTGSSSVHQHCHLFAWEPVSGGSPMGNVLTEINTNKISRHRACSLPKEGRHLTLFVPLYQLWLLSRYQVLWDLTPEVFYEFIVLYQQNSWQKQPRERAALIHMTSISFFYEVRGNFTGTYWN